MGFLSTQATTTNIQTVNPGILVPSGVVFPFAGSVAPSGYLICDGTSYDTTTYAALFSAIGYAHGGSGANFNVPDFRYAFLRGSAANISVTGTGTAGSNQATFTSHGIIRTGMRVRLSSGTLSGLAASTNYFAIVVDANTLAFASSYANAIGNSRIAISGANSAVIIQYEDPDISTRLQSAVGGNATGLGTRQDDQFGSHTHTVGTNQSAGGGGGNKPGAANVNPADTFPATSSTGGNQTNPRNVYVNYIIKT